VKARCGASNDRRETPATMSKAAALTAPQSRPPNNEIMESRTLPFNDNIHLLITILLQVINGRGSSPR